MKKLIALLLAVCLMMVAGAALADDLELKIAHIGPQTGPAAVYGLAVVSCIFFCYWISRIPFCTVCEPISPEDLGFMLRPFADRFFVQ